MSSTHRQLESICKFSFLMSFSESANLQHQRSVLLHTMHIRLRLFFPGPVQNWYAARGNRWKYILCQMASIESDVCCREALSVQNVRFNLRSSSIFQQCCQCNINMQVRLQQFVFWICRRLQNFRKYFPSSRTTDFEGQPEDNLDKSQHHKRFHFTAKPFLIQPRFEAEVETMNAKRGGRDRKLGRQDVEDGHSASRTEFKLP